MSKKFRGMTLAALLLSASTSAFADNNDLVYGDEAATDDTAFVGDMPSEDAYYGDEYVAPVAATQPVGKAYVPVNHYAPAANYGPSRLTASQMQPASFLLGGRRGSSCDSMGCDGGCGGACDSYCDSGCSSGSCGGGGIGKALGMCESDGWIRGGALLWWVQDRSSIPLVSTASGGQFPVLGGASPTAEVAYGGPGGLQGDLSGGFRADVGRYVSDGLGIGGRFWWIGDNGSEYNNASNGAPGSQSIGRPYFDSNFGIESALEVAQPNLFAGSVSAYEELQMYGAEAYARLRFCANKTSRLEMIGGYSYFNIENELGIFSRPVNLTPPNIGRVRTFTDLFETENEFNGGQIGFESLIRRGNWSANMLTKVHLGNMNIRGRQSGSNTDTIVGDNIDSGFLVQANSNSGTYEQDVFTFVPELNFQLGYRFRKHVDFTVGYSFLFFEQVGLAGSQADPIINGLEVGSDGTAGTHPFPQLAIDSLFVHGLDLGVAVTY